MSWVKMNMISEFNAKILTRNMCPLPRNTEDPKSL